MSEDDRDLRDRFVRLRRHDAGRTPAFRAVLERSSRPRVPLALAAAGLAAVVLAALLLARWPRTAPAHDVALAQARALSSWTAPTDGLLELSVLEIPDSLPNLSLTSLAIPELTTPATTSGDSR